MLSLAEYIAQSTELLQIGAKYDQQIGDAIDENTSKREASNIAKGIAEFYTIEYEQFLQASLVEAAQNATTYYSSQVDVELPDNFVPQIVKKQYNERYYGATLASRLLFNNRRLIRTIEKTSIVGVEHLNGTFTRSYPFGAHSNIDKRLLQATIIKIEQDIAKDIAERADIELIRWTLSHRHTKEDICDYLASSKDKAVVKYIEDNNLKLDPKGLYFRSTIPRPPHPNCQCEFHLVRDSQDIELPVVQRALTQIRSIIRRIRGK